MTRINLLPEEFRPVEETPLARRMCIFIGVAVIAALLAGVVYFRLIMLPSERSRNDDLVQQRKNMAPAIKEFDRLVREIKTLDALRLVVEENWDQRVMWAQKLSQLKAIVPGYVWITEMDLSQPRQVGRKKKPSRGILELKVVSASPDLDNLTNFVRILRGLIPPFGAAKDEISRSIMFARDFDQLSHNNIVLEEFDEGKYLEKLGYKTKVTLNVKAVEQPEKAPLKRKKRKAAPKS